ncbi:MAG TPA: DUF4340 domain-containing protein [Chloroflexi bacterium]|nr:DUF4340 domain-containing protein [Chloroflexota bacterium]
MDRLKQFVSVRERLNQALIGLLVIQVILSVVVFWPKAPAAAQAEPVFPALTVGEGEEGDAAESGGVYDIVDLKIADADGNEIHLAKVDGEWVLPEADNFPANVDRIQPVLESIAALNTGRLVTRTDASHKQLQVAKSDFLRRVTFETAGGEAYTLFLGSSPSYGATHFRVEGKNETYLTGELSTWELGTTAVTWIDAQYQNVALADLQRVTLENGNGVFVFFREEIDEDEETGAEAPWTMEGLEADETLATTRVTAMIRQAAVINMLAPLGREEKSAYGLDDPAAVATLVLADKSITVRVGAQVDDGYVVKSSESPYYVRVAEFGVQNLADNGREDFLELPPTPTPAP